MKAKVFIFRSCAKLSYTDPYLYDTHAGAVGIRSARTESANVTVTWYK